MAEAYIYDHVRTPRGRGKVDGALHTVTTLALAATSLKALRDRNDLNHGEVDDVVLGCVDPVGEAGGVIGRMGALAAGLRRESAGHPDQPVLRLRPRQRQLRSGAGDVGTARHDDRRRRRVDEPRRHGRLGRRVAGRSRARHSRLFHAAGRVGGSDRDQIRLFARRRRRLRGAVAAARGGRLGRRAVQEIDPAGQGHQRRHAARS